MRRLHHACLCLLLSFICFPVFSQSVIYVNANVQGGNQDGSSWANAFSFLPSAIGASQYGDEIWVVQGTYLPTQGTNREISFTLKNGVKMYGGFLGTETLLSERDVESNVTILSGDIGATGDSTDNSYTVIYCDIADSTTVLDGFTVTWGVANSEVASHPAAGKTKSGGGMYITGNTPGVETRPIIANCKFFHNHARNYGGGIYIKSASAGMSNPIIEHCDFEFNASQTGGGIYLSGISTIQDLIIQSCSFISNTVDLHGGGINFNYVFGNRDLLVMDCFFTLNYATGAGAGINGEISASVSGIKVSNCIFDNNMSSDTGDGTAITSTSFFEGSSLAVDSSLFLYNKNMGSGIISTFNIPTSLSNCTFLSNTVKSSSCVNTFGSELEIQNCTFEANNSNHSISVLDCDGSTAKLKNTKFISNSNIFSGGRLISLSFNQLEAENCYFEGNESGIGFYGFGSSGNPVSTFLFKNCLFNSNNSADGDFCTVYDLRAIFSNCTFVGNSSLNGSLFKSNYPSDLKFANCIFWNNEIGDVPFNISNSDSLFLSHSSFDLPDCSSLANTPVTCGPGMLYNTDPLFLDTAAGNFHLSPCSPARNAGDNAIVDSLGILTDLSGMPRILEGSVDMGAYETPAYTATLESTTNATCHGLPNGGVAIGVQSGCPPFTLDLGGASTVSLDTPIVLQGLPADSYQLAIIDAQGRADTVLATIGQPPLLLADALVADVSCTDGTPGSATAQASGGTPGYAFAWSNGSADTLLDSLLPGSYALTVTDSPGCTAVDSFTVETAGEIEVDGSASDALCHGDENGTADAVPLGGTAPFAWLWGGGQTDSTLAGLPGGTYSATVTDALGCTGTATVQVIEPDPLILQIAAPMLVCFETSGAEAVASALGGTLPYSFEWQGGETDSVLASVGAGSYAVTLSDANGCTEEQSVEVEETTAVFLQDSVINATSPTASDGGVLVSSVMGGVPPYSFLWDNGSTSQSLENLPPGAYTLTVTDSLGCAFVFEYVVDAGSATGVATGGLSNLSVYPNPASVFLTLEIALPEARHLELRLHGPLGRELFGQPLDLPGGHTRLRLDLPDLPNGLYILSLGDGVRTVARKVVVQR